MQKQATHGPQSMGLEDKYFTFISSHKQMPLSPATALGGATIVFGLLSRLINFKTLQIFWF
jgi:hypothetical protein